jgi:hypothetical protein
MEVIQVKIHSVVMFFPCGLGRSAFRKASSRVAIHVRLILALLGTAISQGTVRAFVGFAFILFSFLRKLTLEESWLRSHFGTEYNLYQKRVRALIPHR